VSEPIDEMTLQNIEKFSDKMITDAGREATTDLSEDEKREKDRANEDLEGFRKWLKGVLGDKITRVEVSTRLVDSPATLVQSEYGVSPSMQKYLRAQAVVENDTDGQFSNIFNQAVLEVNPTHPIIQRLKGERYLSNSDWNAQGAHLLFVTHNTFTHRVLFFLLQLCRKSIMSL
jgi:HSP90 family molecular chaperone